MVVFLLFLKDTPTHMIADLYLSLNSKAQRVFIMRVFFLQITWFSLGSLYGILIELFTIYHTLPKLYKSCKIVQLEKCAHCTHQKLLLLGLFSK